MRSNFEIELIFDFDMSNCALSFTALNVSKTEL